jgi:hypothetical protein
MAISPDVPRAYTLPTHHKSKQIVPASNAESRLRASTPGGTRGESLLQREVIHVMTHVLLFTHGMGVHGDDWASGDDGPVAALKSAAKRYAFFQKKPLEDYVKFVPISYDDVFQTIVTQWQTEAGAVTALPGNTLGSATAWLTNASETEKNFWWSHAADVILYRCFPTYRQSVRARVMKGIADAITPQLAAGNSNISILGHSLGTSVLHDTLHLMGSMPSFDGHPNAFVATNFRFVNVIMIANVSRLLQTQGNGMQPVYKSVVRPGNLADPASYCQRFINVRHEADPVPFPRMFEPVDFDPSRFKNLLVRHYWQANIHDLSHYLLHPRVHIPILRALTKGAAITSEEEKAAVNPDNFPQVGGDFEFVQKVADLVKRLGNLQMKLGDNPTSATLAQTLTQYATAVSV